MEWALVIMLLHGEIEATKKPVENSFGYQTTIIRGFASKDLCNAAAKTLDEKHVLPNSAEPSKTLRLGGSGACIQMR